MAWVQILAGREVRWRVREDEDGEKLRKDEEIGDFKFFFFFFVCVILLDTYAVIEGKYKENKCFFYHIPFPAHCNDKM